MSYNPTHHGRELSKGGLVGLFLLAPVVALLSACNGALKNGAACPDFEAQGPIVQLIYPIPSATGVRTPTTLIYYSSGGPDGSVPISLALGSAEEPPLTPVAVPSPLPAPHATPQFQRGLDFAVDTPSLKPETTYNVFAREQLTMGCSPTKAVQVQIGSFTTE